VSATAAVVGPDAAGGEAAAQGEAEALTHALEIEQVVVISYRQVLGSGLLTPHVEGLLRTLLAQEDQHVRLLEHVLTNRGEIVPVAPTIPEAQSALSRHQVHWSLTHMLNQHDCLKLLVDVESLVENAYFEAVGAVGGASLMRTCAAIMGCEAQHWTVLSGLLNHREATKAVPYPFVEGTP
jgi:hypothetical protein